MDDNEWIPVDKTVARNIPALNLDDTALQQRLVSNGVPPAVPYDGPSSGAPADGGTWHSASPYAPRTASDVGAPASRRGASLLRWLARLLCLGMFVFGAMTVYYLTEQTVEETSSLSQGADAFAEKGAWLVQSGQLPKFEDDPVKWAGGYVLLISYKLSHHGLSIRQQAHVVEFSLLGGIVALNVLTWMSGWAHRRDGRGRIHTSRTFLMYLISMALCAAASFGDQYHKLYVPGRHFDKLDLLLDASGYFAAVTCVFIAWSIGSALYRFVTRK